MIGKNVTILDGVRIGNNVVIEDNVYLDYDVIIRDNVTIKSGSVIGARSILGEHVSDFYEDNVDKVHPLIIGENARIRSGAIIYGDTIIGDAFQTGHNVTIREKTNIGNSVSVGTLSDIQGYCTIGDYVRIHSNVHIGANSMIEKYVWIFPYVILTNDPTPPSSELKGVTLKQFAVVATASVLLPGVVVESDSLIAAGATVIKNVEQFEVVGGNPAKKIADIRTIRNHNTGELVYPWRYTYDKYMPWEGIGYEKWSDEKTDLT